MLKKFVKNTIILTSSALSIRFLGLTFKSYLVSCIGGEGIGLYQLVLSVFMLTASVSTAGISLCVTRFVTEYISEGKKDMVASVIRRCILVALVVSIIIMTLMICFSKEIAVYFLHDIRCVLSIKILGISLPFMAFSACLRGYFYAVRKAAFVAGEQLLEQLVEMGIFMLIISIFGKLSIEYSCAAIAVGTACAEILSCIYAFIAYKINHIDIKKKTTLPKSFVKKFMMIFLPVTGSSLLRSGLSAIENILIPRGLRLYGCDYSKSLSDYGTVTALAMPVIAFPSVLLYSVASLIIPEISEAHTKKHHLTVKSLCNRTYGFTFLFAIPITFLLIVFGKEIGMLFYSSSETGVFITMLAPIAPLMYIDAVTDGILKGLNEQLSYFKYNLIDSIVRVAMTFVLVPNYGIKAVVVVIYTSELLNTTLSVMRLIKITNLRIDIKNYIIKPTVTCIILCVIINMLKSAHFVTSYPVSMIMILLSFIAIYIFVNKNKIKILK